MFRRAYTIPVRPGQPFKLVPIGDIHFDTDECDRDRLQDLMDWISDEEKNGSVVRLCGLGDYLDFMSPSNRARFQAAELYETTRKTSDKLIWDNIQEFVAHVPHLRRRMLFMLTGHHVYRFGVQKISGTWIGKTTDQWIASQLRADFAGDGVALVRLQFPHSQFLDVLAYHGSGGAQTPGGRVQKRMKFAEIAPTAHVVISGHDNAKLAYPRSGLDYSQGSIKRYVVGSGGFQRAYLSGTDAGYAERGGLVPADLGVVVINVQVIERRGRWRIDFHASV